MPRFNVSSGLDSITEKVDRMIYGQTSVNPKAKAALDSMEFSIGQGDSYMPSASAVHNPLWVGDKGILDSAPQGDASVASNPSMAYSWNEKIKKYVAKISDVNDAAPDLIGAQLLSPSMAGWITNAYRQVLTFSQADRLVSPQTGTNPWADVVNLPMFHYAGGFGVLQAAGDLNNNATNDVEVMTSAMSASVVNMEATYRLTVGEMAQNYNPSFPLADQSITEKQAYAEWVLSMYEKVIMLYGNTATGTVGLLNVNAITTFNGGTSLADIAAGVSTTKATDMYLAVAAIITAFLNQNNNQVTDVRIAMTTEALNLLNTTVNSSGVTYKTPMQLLLENYDGGVGKTGFTPKIEFVNEPLLRASTAGNIWNTNAYDYCIISSPSIKGGISEVEQPLLIWARPIDRFVYTDYPGAYARNFKTLKRIGGLLAPYGSAVKVYSGFGVG
jgi:hypothetical protein